MSAVRISFATDPAVIARCHAVMRLLRDVRSGGNGWQFLNWLADPARSAGCATLELDSGVQRYGAQRFYLHKR